MNSFGRGRSWLLQLNPVFRHPGCEGGTWPTSDPAAEIIEPAAGFQWLAVGLWWRSTSISSNFLPQGLFQLLPTNYFLIGWICIIPFRLTWRNMTPVAELPCFHLQTIYSCLVHRFGLAAFSAAHWFVGIIHGLFSECSGEALWWPL